MPTLTPLPSTSELLWSTNAPAPMAVALEIEFKLLPSLVSAPRRVLPLP